jgi:predicted flap endonuclease-1-like 5' DNA nuclease
MATKVTFTLTADIANGVSEGVLLGEFNDWNEAKGIKLKKSKDGTLSASVSLEAGKTYLYRYLLADGRWVNDQNAPNQHDNCVITVPEQVKKTEKVAKKAVAKVTQKSADDLTKIRGIGEKISELLIENGIDSFEKLAGSTFEELRAILDTLGNRGKSYDPTHWAKQAKLAAAGKWDEFKKLHADLKK